MKTKIILSLSILITLIVCSLNQEKSNNQGELNIRIDSTSTIHEGKVDIINVESSTSGEREYLDSANYHIIRGWYVSGEKFIEHYQNKETKVDSCKEYYENGVLKKEGLMTTSSHHYIGVWMYYSDQNIIDSIVDYDSNHPISYFEAVDIAKQYSFEMPDIEITKTYSEGKMFWDVTKWIEMNDGENHQMGKTILIDSQTGKINIPEYQKYNIY